MKKLSGILALGLALVLVMTALTGCGGDLTDPGNYGTQVAATIGDETIYMDQANYFLRYNQWSMESYYWDYYQYYGYTNMWEAPSTDNIDRSMDTNLRVMVMDELLQTKNILRHADEYGIALDDDDKALVQTLVSDLRENLHESFWTYTDVTDEQLTSWYEDNALATKTYNKIRSEAEVSVDEADCKGMRVKYFTLPLTDEALETAADLDTSKAEAEYVVNEVNYNGRDFDEAANELTITPTERIYYYANEVAEDDKVDEMAREMKTGEAVCTKVEDDCWYVVYCVSDDDADAAADKKASLEDEQRQAYFDEVYASWDAPEFEVMDCYNEILVTNGEMIFTEKTETEADAVVDEADGEDADAEGSEAEKEPVSDETAEEADTESESTAE